MSFETLERVDVDLHTGRETRTPIGDRPAETLQVTATSDAPASERHHVGRITDVKTDAGGNPRVEQRGSHEHERPSGSEASAGTTGDWSDTPPTGWPPGTPWPPQTALRAELARTLIRDQEQARSGGSRGFGSGIGPRAGGGRRPRPAPTPQVRPARPQQQTWMDRRAFGWFR